MAHTQDFDISPDLDFVRDKLDLNSSNKLFKRLKLYNVMSCRNFKFKNPIAYKTFWTDRQICVYRVDTFSQNIFKSRHVNPVS